MNPATEPTLPVSGARFEGVDGWRVRNVRIEVHGHLAIEIENQDKKAEATLILSPKGSTGESLVETRFGDVAYATYSGIGEKELADVTREFAQCLELGLTDIPQLFPHLLVPSRGHKVTAENRRLLGSVLSGRPLLSSEEKDDGALTGPETEENVFFDPPGLAEFLEPEFVVDGPPVLGYVLRSVSIPPVARREAPDFRSFLLALEPLNGGEECQVLIGAADALSLPFGVAGEIAVGLRHFGRGQGDELPPAAARICSWLLGLISLKQSEGFELKFPEGPQSVRALSVPAAPRKTTDIVPGEAAPSPVEEGPLPALNLTIDAECEQSCAFCSLKSYMPASDGGEEELEFLRLQLETARAKGIRELRLNGIDPLAFSKVFEALDLIKDLGFESLTVYTPGKQLGDPEFRGQFLAKSPSELKVVIPIYGLDAATHDAVTGLEGSYEKIQAAIEGMRADAPEGQLALSTVVVKQNMHAFTHMVAWAAEQKLEFQAHLPYPMKQSLRDNYTEVAIREEEVIQNFLNNIDAIPEALRDDASAWLGEVLPHPCLLWKTELQGKGPFLRERVMSVSNLMDGTDYRSDRYAHGSDAKAESTAFAAATIPCTHQAECALSPVCPGEHYALYDQLFGLDEFQAVSVLDVYTALDDAKFRANRQNDQHEAELRNLERNALKGLERIEREVKRQSRQQKENTEAKKDAGAHPSERVLKKKAAFESTLSQGLSGYTQKMAKGKKELQASIRTIGGHARDFSSRLGSPGSLPWLISTEAFNNKIEKVLLRLYRRKIGGDSIRLTNQLQAHINDTHNKLATLADLEPFRSNKVPFDADKIVEELRKKLTGLGEDVRKRTLKALFSGLCGTTLLIITAILETKLFAPWLFGAIGGSLLALAPLQISRMRVQVEESLTQLIRNHFQGHWSKVESFTENECKVAKKIWANVGFQTAPAPRKKAEPKKAISAAIVHELEAMKALLDSKAAEAEDPKQ